MDIKIKVWNLIAIEEKIFDGRLWGCDEWVPWTPNEQHYTTDLFREEGRDDF